MEILLLKLVLHRIIFDIDLKPIGATKRRKWFDRRDETLGTLLLSISLDLRYHVAYFTHPNQIWTIFEGLFGKPDKMRKFKLENELMSLNPSYFDNIQDFFSKINSLKL